MTIFSILVIGFLLIFLVVMGINVYTLVQLHQLTKLTDSVLRFDDRLLEYENKLRESFLSQVRYGKRYLITKDPAFQQQFSTFKKDFLLQLDNAASVADVAMSSALVNLRKQYQLYNGLVEGEMRGGTVGTGSSQQQSAIQTNEMIETILTELETIKNHGQSSIRNKIENLSQAVTTAKQVTTWVGVLDAVRFVVAS